MEGDMRGAHVVSFAVGVVVGYWLLPKVLGKKTAS
jgi:hypothetical protein